LVNTLGKIGKMLGNQKNVFWEALLLTAVVFIFGIFMGIAFESNRLDKINEYYAKSELSLMDIFALNSFANLESTECDELLKSNIGFANKVYEEALLLEEYEASGVITDTIKIAHKKYDLLRTFLWGNTIKTKEKCGNGFSTVVYLYEYEPVDLAQRATQNVWSKILFDLKEKRGDNIILISIATDQEIESLNVLTSRFNVSTYPVVIINEEHVITELTSVEELEKYLDEKV